MLSVLINLDSHYVHIRFDYVWLFKHTYVHTYVCTYYKCVQGKCVYTPISYVRNILVHLKKLWVWPTVETNTMTALKVLRTQELDYKIKRASSFLLG